MALPARFRWRGVLGVWAWMGMTIAQPALAMDEAPRASAHGSISRSSAAADARGQNDSIEDAPRDGRRFSQAAQRSDTVRTGADASASALADVELSPEGELHAVICDEQGRPRAGVPVLLAVGTQSVATTKTDSAGVATFERIRPGTYELKGPGWNRSCRVWAHGTAPPAARSAVVVERHPVTVRGQIGPPLLGDSTGLLGLSPLLTLGVIAAAIAIPVGIAAANDDDNPPPASP